MLKKMSEKLQQARKSVGLNQSQVADMMGISRSKVINIEKGEVAIDVVLLGKISSFVWLFGRTFH
jgi:Helix-turn-helix.